MTSSDTAFATLADEIAAARGALVALMEVDGEQWWQAYDLKVRARNGWSAGAVGLALNRLIDEGLLEVDGDRVRLRG